MRKFFEEDAGKDLDRINRFNWMRKTFVRDAGYGFHATVDKDLDRINRMPETLLAEMQAFGLLIINTANPVNPVQRVYARKRSNKIVGSLAHL
jgi:hypothetical protein